MDEVGSGELPNAFLKSTSADVSSGNSELIFKDLGCRVPLKTNLKGLFTVELSEVFQLFSKSGQNDWNSNHCEVVTFASDHVDSSNTMNRTSTAAAFIDQSVSTTAANVAHTRDPRSVLLRSSTNSLHGEHEGQPIDGRESGSAWTAPVPRRCRAELCESKSSPNSPSSGHCYPGPVGGAAFSGRETPEQELQGGVRPRSQVSGFHDESSKSHKSLGVEQNYASGHGFEHKPNADQAGLQGNGCPKPAASSKTSTPPWKPETSSLERELMTDHLELSPPPKRSLSPEILENDSMTLGKDAEKEQALMTKIAILWRELDLMIKQSENLRFSTQWLQHLCQATLMRSCPLLKMFATANRS